MSMAIGPHLPQEKEQGEKEEKIKKARAEQSLEHTIVKKNQKGVLEEWKIVRQKP